MAGRCRSKGGYATAQSLNLPFLTGDEGFRGVPGVKFVKAWPLTGSPAELRRIVLAQRVPAADGAVRHA